MERWLSAHLQFDGLLYGEDGDRVITSVVEPFINRARREGWITGFFFIRYSEGRSHIRLRLHGLPVLLEERVRPALVGHVETTWPWQDASAGEGIIQWAAYEPELQRYGGPAAIAVAEACFEASSQLAFALTHKIDPGVRPSRLAKALLAMLVLVYAFYPERAGAIRFVEQYSTRNLSGFAREEGQRLHWRDAFDAGFEHQANLLAEVVGDVWERLTASEALTVELDAFLAAVRGVRRDLEMLIGARSVRVRAHLAASAPLAFAWIVPSYVHMTSNRIGITIPEEAYLARLVERSLSAPLVAEPPRQV